MSNKLKNYAIILASGNGSRFGSSLPKQFTVIGDKTILEHSIEVFEKNELIDGIILVVTPEYREKFIEILCKNNYKKVLKILNGGKIRKESSYIGVCGVGEEANLLIHDCARPFVSQRVINECIKALESNDAVNVAISSTDTILEIENGYIKCVPNRSSLMRSQTPQCFKYSVIKKAHELSLNDTDFTDDCGLVLKHNLAKIFIVEGDVENIKITYPSDEILAKSILASRE